MAAVKMGPKEIDFKPKGGGIKFLDEKEALAAKPDTVCVSCPYCLTMFEDGLKDKQAGGVRVRDIAEVVAEGLRG